jgi:SAM-dependent methyltransferase
MTSAGFMRKTYRLLWRHGFAPTLKGPNPLTWMVRYIGFWRDLRTYMALPAGRSLPVNLLDSFPRLEDRTASTSIESHYFHQSVWAAQLIARYAPRLHVDIGSDHRFVGALTSLTRVVFADIRPLATRIPGLFQAAGDVLHLPFKDGSLESLSSLHVAEHVGLGRYGDPLNPSGTREAAAELTRVLAPGGNLYFSVPVGRPRLEFNAHRIHSPAQISGFFADLRLQGFSAEDDARVFVHHANQAELAEAQYACGLFWFQKPR